MKAKIKNEDKRKYKKNLNTGIPDIPFKNKKQRKKMKEIWERDYAKE